MLLRCPGLSWWGQSGLRGVPVRERGWQCLLQVPSALNLKCKDIHLEDAAPKTPICSAGRAHVDRRRASPTSKDRCHLRGTKGHLHCQKWDT